MQFACEAFSGESGHCGDDILWAISHTARWPLFNDAPDGEEFAEALGGKAKFVRSRTHPAPLGVEARGDRWGDCAADHHGQQGFATVSNRAKGDADKGRDLSKDCKGHNEGKSNAGGK